MRPSTQHQNQLIGLEVPFHAQTNSRILHLHFFPRINNTEKGDEKAKKGTDLFFQINPWPTLPSLLYSYTNNPLHLVHKTARPRQLTSLQSIPNQSDLIRWNGLAHERLIPTTTLRSCITQSNKAWISIQPMAVWHITYPGSIARPWVIRSISHHTSPYRIQLDVTATGKQVRIRLHHTGFVTAFS